MLLLMMMLLRILHFANATIIYASIINGCIFTIVGMLNSLLEAYTMRSIDEQYLGQYYTVLGNLNVLLMPVITYTLGFVLRFVPPVYVYTAAGFILLLPTLYIHMQMHLSECQIW